MKISTLTILLLAILLGWTPHTVLAQTISGASYVPLIGITSVPDPFALSGGAGDVTYHYAVKNFLAELPLSDIKVVDNKCPDVVFVEGDDNYDNKLDASETWRYACTTQRFSTTESIAMATGVANNLTATDSAYTTVVVGSDNLAPLVSVVNVTKVAYPLSLPAGGGDITFTYRVNNPGLTPLNNVVVVDNKCTTISGKLGDTNGNNFLDISEVWIYHCTVNLTETTTNTVTVTAFANGLKAVDSYTLTVKVDSPIETFEPNFPDTGASPNAKMMAWEVLSGVLLALILFYFLRKRKNTN